jgi:DNA-binding ferritin-like protein
LINEEVGAVFNLASMPVSVSSQLEEPISLETELMGLLACLRCANVWFHAAHQVTKGVGFAGDHVNIYGEIYDSLVDDYDGAAEKAIGLTGNENVACPHAVLALALEKMQNYPTPAGAGASSIAGTALQIMRDLNSHVEEVFTNLEAEGMLALGLNDFLAAAANDYTKYIYLLQQRTKET